MRGRSVSCALAGIVLLLAGRGLPGARTHQTGAPPSATVNSNAPPIADPSIARALAGERPVRHVLRALTADLDHDGDVDVIASTVEETVVVWLNDGLGHFTRQRPARAPQLDAVSRIGSPPGGDAPSSTTLKWLGAMVDAAEAAGDAPVDRLDLPDGLRLSTRPTSSLAPRGPPANVSI